jgi:hypothetical protein
MAALLVGLWMWANGGRIHYRGTLSPERLAATMGVGLLALGAMVFVARKQLLTSQANTRLVGGVLLAGAAIFVNRVLNCIPAPPTASLVSSEIVLCAFGSAFGGLTLARWLWGPVPVLIAGAFAARLIPSHAGLCFAIVCSLFLGYSLWQLRARSRGTASWTS